MWGGAAGLLDRSRRFGWVDLVLLVGIIGLIYGLRGGRVVVRQAGQSRDRLVALGAAALYVLFLVAGLDCIRIVPSVHACLWLLGRKRSDRGACTGADAGHPAEHPGPDIHARVCFRLGCLVS